MEVAATRLPKLVWHIYDQIDVEKQSTKIPEIAANKISACDVLVKSIVQIAGDYGIDYHQLSLRYANHGRIVVGAGRQLTGLKLSWLVADIIERVPDQAAKITRSLRNAAITAVSNQALLELAEAVDQTVIDNTYADRLAAIQGPPTAATA